MWIRVIFRVCRREVGCAADRAVNKEAVVRTQRRICDGPLAIRILHCLVVLPLVWIGCIVHPNLEILFTAEKEVPIIGELTRETSGVVVDDFVCLRAWNHALHDQICQISMQKGGTLGLTMRLSVLTWKMD